MKLLGSVRLLRANFNKVRNMSALSTYSLKESNSRNWRRLQIDGSKRYSIPYHSFSSSHIHSADDAYIIDAVTYDKVCTETLEALYDYFEELLERIPHLKSPDITYGDGVLTVKFGDPYGTYVINRQTPNKQIWLSSPTSGPKRYDFVKVDSEIEGYWIYKHDGISLHELLQTEIHKIAKEMVEFRSLPYAKR